MDQLILASFVDAMYVLLAAGVVAVVVEVWVSNHRPPNP